jgi:hypothetical protein
MLTRRVTVIGLRPSAGSASRLTLRSLPPRIPTTRARHIVKRAGAQCFPWGKAWDRQPISGKLRRELVSVPGLRRIVEAGGGILPLG